MSVPLDKLYCFLEDQIDTNVVIYHWFPHGSKKLSHLRAMRKFSNAELYFRPTVIFHDQEPYDYQIWSDKEFKRLCQQIVWRLIQVRITNEELRMIRQNHGINCLTTYCNQYDQSILVHSNFNLTDINRRNHVPCFYWSHALIALDWFRYAKHDSRLTSLPTTTPYVFLCYNRTWEGLREYRAKFSELLFQADLHPLTHTWFSPTIDGVSINDYQFQDIRMRPCDFSFASHFSPSAASAHSSAMYDIDDYATAQWEVVLETVFDSSSIFLTEKIFRPMVCRRPFILAAPRGSLAMLQRYGFKTFGEYIDESYDSVADPLLRLQAIISAMQSVVRLSNKDLQAIQAIAQHNFDHAFSEEFFTSVMDEFKTNMSVALEELRSNQSGLRQQVPKRWMDIGIKLAPYRNGDFDDIINFLTRRQN